MRLAILHPFQFRYARGIERYTWSLSNALAQRGVEIDLLTWRWPNPISWGESPANIRVREMPNLRYFRAQTAALWYLSQLAPRAYDRVMLFFADYGEAGAMRMLRYLRQQPYSIVFHFPYEQVPHRYAGFKRSGLAEHADSLIAVSAYVAHGVEAQFGKPCAVIPNGVDVSVFRPSPEARTQARQQLGIAPDTPVLITLAALEERKGVQCLIRAIPHLLSEFPSLCYLVLGEGAYRATLEAEIHNLKLEDHVRLLGVSDNVVPLLAAADVGCLLSRGEAFPLTLIEIMAMELPVVTSHAPPFDELVQPSWGITVDEQDTLAVAEQIRQLLRAPERRATMGHAGRDQVLKNYTWDRVADAYLKELSL